MKITLMMMVIVLAKCTTPPKQSKKELTITKSRTNNNVAVAKKAEIKPEPSRCIPYPKNLFLKDVNVAITTATKTCSDSTVEKGFLPESDFIAMGFPCSGGDGRVDWKGSNYSKPKMVSFLLETNCLVSSATYVQILTSLEKLAGKKLTGKILAVNPFMVQFWYAPGLDDADASFSIDLRSNRALDKVWNRYSTKNEAIPVHMYGRENAWTNQDAFYAVNGEIFSTGKNRFRLRVNNSEMLEKKQIEDVKKRCETLKPARDCSIF